MSIRRILSAFAAMAVLLVAGAATASAHVTITPGDVPADGYAEVELMVPHGCDDQPTNELSVELDPGVQSVRAEAVPGWSFEYTMAALDEPYELHGTEITEYVASITWTVTTGEPIPTDGFMTFGINAKWPATPGESLAIPAVQRCPDGSETAWIETEADAEHPAPVVQIVASDEGGHDHDEATEDEMAEDEMAEDEEASSDDTSDMTVSGDDEAAAGDSSSDDDSSSNTLGIVAVVLAIVAIGVSGFAIASAKRT